MGGRGRALASCLAGEYLPDPGDAPPLSRPPEVMGSSGCGSGPASVTISLFLFFGLSWGGCTHGIWRSPG